MSSKRSRRVTSLEGKCYYKVLGVPVDAIDHDIKRAYRKLALKYHPDKNREDPDYASEMFKHVAEAFEVLSDKDKRRKYDRYGREGQSMSFDFRDASTLFEEFFSSDPFFSSSFGNNIGQSRSSFMSSNMSNMFDMGFSSFDDGFGSSIGTTNAFSSPSGNSNGSYSKSTRTVTNIVNGERVTRTETTIKYPDGSVETTCNENRGLEERESKSQRLNWF